ncbi:MAG: ABC transporter permease [Tetrasphaera sp.]|jgi:ABC-2 type transport system permease protein|nr:ABC transporter permease [Tetrasphaera sp.]
MASFLRALRSELRLIAGRRRNQVGLLVLMSLPVLIAIATKESTRHGGDNRGGPDFFDQITSNGLFVALAALGVEIGLFLPMALALISGDAIAGEAQTGTLRYVLTVPVGRVRLLAVKYAALLLAGLLACAAVAFTGGVVGAALFGTGSATTLSGSQIGVGATVWRILLATLYVAAGMAAVAAIGLFLSTLTEQPIAVVVMVMVVIAGSWILDAIPQVAWLHPWLVVDRWPAFADLMRDPPRWGTIRAGLGVDAAYAVVFLLAAWARFTSKDITS